MLSNDHRSFSVDHGKTYVEVNGLRIDFEDAVLSEGTDVLGGKIPTFYFSS